MPGGLRDDAVAPVCPDPARPYLLGTVGGMVFMIPPFPTREHLVQIFPVKAVQRLIAAGWLTKVDLGSRETHFSIASVLAAIDRITAGERPPRLPSEPEPKGTRRVPLRNRR